MAFLLFDNLIHVYTGLNGVEMLVLISEQYTVLEPSKSALPIAFLSYNSNVMEAERGTSSNLNLLLLSKSGSRL